MKKILKSRAWLVVAAFAGLVAIPTLLAGMLTTPMSAIAMGIGIALVIAGLLIAMAYEGPCKG